MEILSVSQSVYPHAVDTYRLKSSLRQMVETVGVCEGFVLPALISNDNKHIASLFQLK